MQHTQFIEPLSEVDCQSLNNILTNFKWEDILTLKSVGEKQALIYAIYFVTGSYENMFNFESYSEELSK